MENTIRLAVVNSHPIQYFAPLYAYLNRDANIDVTALYCSDFSLRGATDEGFGREVTWDVDLLTGYRSVFLGEGAKRRVPSGFWSLVCPRVWSEIRSGKYDAVLVHGYAYAVNVLAWLAAKSKGIPVLMRSETHLRLTRAKWKQRLRDFALSIAYRSVDGFLAIGTANEAYYRSLGVPGEKIFIVPFAVDNERFMGSAEVSPSEKAELRRNHGLPVEGTVVLYASKLQRRKHPDDVIRALAQLRDKGLASTLFMVGSGEMEQELRDSARSLGMTVVFGGFINQRELPKVFALSDVFVLPSENEPWGLIVNEVMCAGVPVVVSEETGCVPDLVKDGVNGYHMKAGDVASLTAALEKLLGDEPNRRRMGAQGRSIIGRWGYERCRQGITAALQACASR